MLLWPFNKYPGTDYETFNWEWILKTVKEWVAKMQTFQDTITAEWDVMKNAWKSMQDAWQEFVDDTYKDQIEEILENHPEWVTTVMDHSLTLAKFAAGVLPYVTPEMFGAAGDGVTDDTAAWQAAIDAADIVIADSEIYKCGELFVNKNMTIDCNGCKFITTAPRLFNCSGTIKTSFTGEPDYVDGESHYAITNNADQAQYTGFAMIRGVNNPFKQRDYFRGGFVGMFADGMLTESFPVDATNVTVSLIDPITVEIKNIENVETTVSDTYVVMITYGLNCKVSNIKCNDIDAFSIVRFTYSYNCVAEQIQATVTAYTGALSYNYPIEIESSNFCCIRNCKVYNKVWHAASITGDLLAYNNVFEDCHFTSNSAFAYGTHSNSNRETFIRCLMSGASFGEECIVKDCTIVSRINASGCNVALEYTARQNHAGAYIDGILFDLKTGTISASGFILEGSPQVQGLDVYADNIIIQHVRSTNSTNNVRFRELSDNTNFNSITIGSIVLDDVDIWVSFAVPLAATVFNIANYWLRIRNSDNVQFREFATHGHGNIELSNLTITMPGTHSMTGELLYNNVRIPNNTLWVPEGATLAKGANVTCRRFNAAWLAQRENVKLSAVYNHLDNQYYETIVSQGSGNPAYGRRIGNDGNVTVVEIT